MLCCIIAIMLLIELICEKCSKNFNESFWYLNINKKNTIETNFKFIKLS
jgi:hypothetical protein